MKESDIWVNGLPEVGVKCDGFFKHGASHKWRKVEILMQNHEGKECAVYVPELHAVGWCYEFRPTLSEKERARIELRKTIEEALKCKLNASGLTNVILADFEIVKCSRS